MAFGKRAGIALAALVFTACQTLGLVRDYEYEESVELSLDGSAVVDITASIPALVVLRGATFSVDPEARLDRRALRHFYEGPGVSVRDVSAFRRHGRRFVHLRLDVENIAALPQVVPLAWSSYRLDRFEEEFRFAHEVGPAANIAVGDVGWGGNELVAFRVHLPSRINFHNSPTGVERGNILIWEQTLQDRMSGMPLRMEARMQTDSILYHTLWLFGGSFVSAMLALAGILFWVSRKGRRTPKA